MVFNPLILRLGVPPLAEGGMDFPNAASVGLFQPVFHRMQVVVLELEGKLWNDTAPSMAG